MNIYNIIFWTGVTIKAIIAGLITMVITSGIFKLISMIFGPEVMWKIFLCIIALNVIAIIDTYRNKL